MNHKQFNLQNHNNSSLYTCINIASLSPISSTNLILPSLLLRYYTVLPLVSFFLSLLCRPSMAGLSIYWAMRWFVVAVVLLLAVARAQDSGGLAPLPAMDAGTGFQVTFSSGGVLLSMFLCLVALLCH